MHTYKSHVLGQKKSCISAYTYIITCIHAYKSHGFGNRKIRIHTSIAYSPSSDFINFCGESKCRMKSWPSNMQSYRSAFCIHIRMYTHIKTYTPNAFLRNSTPSTHTYIHTKIYTPNAFLRNSMPSTHIHTH
jgi:hypothetical protein